MQSSIFNRISLCVYLSVATIASSIACSCGWNTPEHFCRSINETEHVVLAVVLDAPEWYYMEVDVIEDINLVTGADTISILGQDGLNCGANIGNFEIGDTVILALYNGYTEDANDGNSFDWSLGGCGLHFLKYSNGIIQGNIDFGMVSQPYEDFKSGILNCAELSSSTKDNLNKADLFLMPNPVSNRLDIFIENSNDSEYNFDILDISGKVVYPNIYIQGALKSVDLSDLDSGIYFLRTRSTLDVVSKKFIKI